MRDNRHCSVPGCRAWGGAEWMDDHETQLHVTCTCGGWVGLRNGHSSHVGWAVTHGGQAEHRHQMRALPTEDSL